MSNKKALEQRFLSLESCEPSDGSQTPILIKLADFYIQNIELYIVNTKT